jgi:hypothetical protein
MALTIEEAQALVQTIIQDIAGLEECRVGLEKGSYTDALERAKPCADRIVKNVDALDGFFGR